MKYKITIEFETVNPLDESDKEYHQGDMVLQITDYYETKGEVVYKLEETP